MASGSTLARSHQFGYDDANRLVTYANSIDGSVDYQYDDRGQVNEADYSASGTSSESYYYDGNGNRSYASNDASGGFPFYYSHGPNNQLTSDGKFNYEYDDAGNRTRRTDVSTGDYIVYKWDHRNRLTAAVDYDSNGTPTSADDVVTQRVDYHYDGFNQLVKRVVDADGATGTAPIDQTFYHYDQGQVPCRCESAPAKG